MFTYSKTKCQEIDRFVKSENNIAIPCSKTNKLSEIIFASIISKYQNNVFEKMKKTELVVNYVVRVVFTCHNVTLKHGGLHIYGGLQ